MRRRGATRQDRPVRGVNLGNWLVLERWMESEARPGPFAGATADDERGLRRELPADELARRLEHHRATYVTRDTFGWLAEQGCTLARVPVPFFLFGDDTHEPCVEHLDRALDWADEAGVRVLVDLHTVPGGQNGFDNGGVCGLCSWHLSSRRIARTLDVLERIARRYAGHPALFGLEPMNEPASPRIFAQSMVRYGASHPTRVERSAPIPHDVLAQFYRLAYERLHPILGPGVALVLHDQFQLERWERFLPADRYPDVWLDTHLYVGTAARGAHARSLATHLAITRALGLRVARAQRRHRVLVGEWSLSHNLRGFTALGPSTRDETLRAYATAQLAAFERGSGGCFWSLRNASYATWSFETSVARGWLDYRRT